MQCKAVIHVTLQHQQYLNKALQLWNDGFFYSHTEYDIHVHFHLSWWKQIAHAIQTFENQNISLQSVEEYTMTIQVLMIMSFKWTPISVLMVEIMFLKVTVMTKFK